VCVHLAGDQNGGKISIWRKREGERGYTYVCIFTYDVSVEISYTIHAYSSILNVCMKRKAICCLSLHPSNLLKDSLRFLDCKNVVELCIKINF
jgi:hypothetical protein